MASNQRDQFLHGHREKLTAHVRRAKRGTPATHPIVGDELRALRRLQREQDPKSPFVFTPERGSPFTTQGLPACWRALARLPGSASRFTRHAAARLWFRAGE